ncbi:hypothetical protein F2P56_011028 [Juglans regia]|uniref:Transmembrane protein n=2 Tax=Juglans regia TaxID=51240 RepID=A0A833XKY2_JUGRE|nr:uncharacterized protein LOC109017722 [Juglans regia]KAF5470522.1 hypothetical protein F2P56_011028 [Juglans regia]
MTTTSLSLSPKPFLSIFKSKPKCFLNTHLSSLPFTSQNVFSSKRTNLSHNLPREFTRPSTQIWRVSAASEGGDVLPIEATPLLENSQELVSTSDDGVSTIISTLLFIGFIGLSVLTIGVIYIAVTDFLQKREREKFEKEEAAKEKKSGKKKKVRAKAGPKGFGQRTDDRDDD